ncbi:hypothetical protein CW304_04140 [Bacillus sp. UFRGS-B20]|nr:hypothetical protein CW304_04140 [Bacillus sp. UFRGS-B20]
MHRLSQSKLRFPFKKGGWFKKFLNFPVLSLFITITARWFILVSTLDAFLVSVINLLAFIPIIHRYLMILHFSELCAS